MRSTPADGPSSAPPLSVILEALQCKSYRCACHISAKRGHGNTHCPAHDDAKPSLGIAEGDGDRKPLWRCYAGCSQDAVREQLAARGLLHVIRDRSGRVQAFHERKGRWASPDGTLGLNGTRTVSMLYGIEKLSAADDAGVVITEGEKAADAAQRLLGDGYVALGTVGGSGVTPSTAVLSGLRGRRVWLWPDNADDGRAHMQNIAHELLDIGDIEIRFVEWAGAPPKGDAADWTADADAMRALLADAQPWLGGDDPDDDDISPIDWQGFWTEDEAPRGEWIAEGIIHQGRQTHLYSAAKAGKSLLALDISAARATGRPVLGEPDEDAKPPIDIVYIDLEMTADDLRERLESLGYGPDDDLSHLHYYQLPALPPLDTDAGGKRLLGMVRRHHTELVVIDTIARAVEGEENQADTYRAFYRYTGMRLKAAGVALVRLDNTGRDTSHSRGSAAKEDDVDLVFRLEAPGGGQINLVNTHSRIQGVRPQVILLREEDPFTRHVLRPLQYREGTQDCAALLDELDVPIDARTTEAVAALHRAGKGKRRAVVIDALRYRRERR